MKVRSFWFPRSHLSPLDLLLLGRIKGHVVAMGEQHRDARISRILADATHIKSQFRQLHRIRDSTQRRSEANVRSEHAHISWRNA
jgi:hypothetical protein